VLDKHDKVECNVYFVVTHTFQMHTLLAFIFIYWRYFVVTTFLRFLKYFLLGYIQYSAHGNMFQTSTHLFEAYSEAGLCTIYRGVCYGAYYLFLGLCVSVPELGWLWSIIKIKELTFLPILLVPDVVFFFRHFLWCHWMLVLLLSPHEIKSQNTYLCLLTYVLRVGIATNYGLDDGGIEVRVPVGSRIFSTPNRPDRL
jgi:hypothetical protein